MNITELIAAFGSYYRAGSQGVKDIDTSFYQPLVTEGFFGGLKPTLNTQERRVKSIIGQILRRKQRAFTGGESTEFLPRTIELQELSYELKEYPDIIQKSYIGFLASLDTNDRAKWPITKYIVDVLMIKKGQAEYELNEVYKGEAAPIVPGTPNNPGENFDGVEHQMNLAIDASLITPINGPTTWNADPKIFLQEIEEWIENVKASDNEARLLIEGGAVTKIAMNTALRDRLAKGLFKEYNINYNATNQEIVSQTFEVPLPFSNLVAVGLPSMSGKQRIFMTPELNKEAFIKRPQSETGPEIQKFDREVKIMMDYWKGIGFWHPEYVYTTQHEVPVE